MSNCPAGALSKKLFDKAMADHAVTDNSDSDFAHFASISFLYRLPTLTIQLLHSLIQINLELTYHLMGIFMIYNDFSK